MTRQFESQKTPLGIVNGRDGIYLDDITVFPDGADALVLMVAFNTTLCSEAENKDGKFNNFELTFNNVLALKIVELDSWDFDSESSFDEVINSQWIKELGGKVTPKDRHYLIQTYDLVIEVVCRDYEFKDRENSTANK